MAYVVMVNATFANKADAEHIYNQAKAVAVNASVAHIGEETGERTSHALFGEEISENNINVEKLWHIDLFGIVREGEPDLKEVPDWIQPTGAHDAYPANNVRGEETRVTHNAKVWRNIHGRGNSWGPSVYGWMELRDDR